jgi:hypothetical protein
MKFLSLIGMIMGCYFIVQSIYFGLAMANGFVMTIDRYTDIYLMIVMILVGSASITFSFLHNIMED